MRKIQKIRRCSITEVTQAVHRARFISQGMSQYTLMMIGNVYVLLSIYLSITIIIIS